MLVRIVKNWNSPDLFHQTHKNSGIWDDIQFTEEKVSECDILIVLNAPYYQLFVKCRPGGKWLMSQESPLPVYSWHKRSFRHFDKVFTFWNENLNKNIIHEQTALPWHINKSYDELKLISEFDLDKKRDELSWITSNYSHKPGHKIRMDFLAYLQNQNFSFDLFGKGFNPIEDKFQGIFPYKYSLAFENYSCNDYWTEKIADCFLSWTMPVYYGCSNICDYFPSKSMIQIDPSDPNGAVEKIRSAIRENLWKKNLREIKEARELILDKYQFFPHITKKIKEYYGNNLQLDKKKWFYIPKNMEGQSTGVLNTIYNKITIKIKNAHG